MRDKAWLLFLFLFLSCAPQKEKPAQDPNQIGITEFPSEAIPVDRILNEKEKFLGKEVVVQGNISEQCPLAKRGHGCYMRIAGDRGSSLYVEFQEAGLMYPKEYKGGSKIILYGVFQLWNGEPVSARLSKKEPYIRAKGAKILSEG